MIPPLTDEALIEQHLPTNPSACFDELYSRYVNKVYHRCLTFTKDGEQAQDFTHDIFLKVFAKLSSFQGNSRFSTWLYSVTYNYCADQHQRGKRISTQAFEGDQHDCIDENEQAGTEERIQQLKGVVNGLPAAERTLLRLRYEEELSIEAIAQQLGIRASAVKMRLKRTRDKIHSRYQQLAG
ncbi:sigma-70 family RNA polymerase sigma factor [Fibrisoma montanum]|uniref:Sigma-70 family RNA polymerase sigma factor n=1 Tax=Fibrisoma montanum TaxID=2305895 RepID=A0A418ME77_9BACT|nr:sigma-70 family RNA polymerase sigma factor [Fibrisoma montanum]RIV25114.1 sigma-70 family RNA polymerase sigma factor [Fibrisoma montanum]